MIIKAKPLPFSIMKWGFLFLAYFFKRRFNKIVVNNNITIKPGCSYLLMCNHFSFADGFFAYYLCFKWIAKRGELKGIYTMSLKKQMEKNQWLKYSGSFSVEPASRSVHESLNYAAAVLSQPGNLLVFFPQGRLESCHIGHIAFKDGIKEIIAATKGDCQLIWSSNIIEYFESTKPSVHLNLLDCGAAHNFNFETLKAAVNKHHALSLKKMIRFTKEP
jgi:1-acyl-sn-glycerol-3-phosphate acyltransferase